MNIAWRGMAKDAVVHSLRVVVKNAAEHGCTCEQTGREPQKHDKSCWTYMYRNHYRIVNQLADKIEAA